MKFITIFCLLCLTACSLPKYQTPLSGDTASIMMPELSYDYKLTGAYSTTIGIAVIGDNEKINHSAVKNVPKEYSKKPIPVTANTEVAFFTQHFQGGYNCTLRASTTLMKDKQYELNLETANDQCSLEILEIEKQKKIPVKIRMLIQKKGSFNNYWKTEEFSYKIGREGDARPKIIILY